MKNFIKMFLRQVKLNPDNEAVLDKHGVYTYSDLNVRSAYLSHSILKLIPDNSKTHRIALFMPRVKDFIVSEIAILRSGCAVVPIDGEYPAERVQTILESADCTLCLTTSELKEKVGGVVSTLTMEDVFPENEEVPTNCDMPDFSDPDKEGFIFFTSGSTGKPKGVLHKQSTIAYIPEAFDGIVQFTPKCRS